MIIYQDKGYETCSNFPKENFSTNNPNIIGIVDETTLKGLIIAQKIQILYPNYRILEITNEYITKIEEILSTDPDYIPPTIM